LHSPTTLDHRHNSSLLSLDKYHTASTMKAQVQNHMAINYLTATQDEEELTPVSKKTACVLHIMYQSGTPTKKANWRVERLHKRQFKKLAHLWNTSQNYELLVIDNCGNIGHWLQNTGKLKSTLRNRVFIIASDRASEYSFQKMFINGGFIIPKSIFVNPITYKTHVRKRQKLHLHLESNSPLEGMHDAIKNKGWIAGGLSELYYKLFNCRLKTMVKTKHTKRIVLELISVLICSRFIKIRPVDLFIAFVLRLLWIFILKPKLKQIVIRKLKKFQSEIQDNSAKEFRVKKWADLIKTLSILLSNQLVQNAKKMKDYFNFLSLFHCNL